MFDNDAGEYVHKPNAKLPYSKLKARGISIDGLPGRCKVLKRPSSYGRQTLKEILEQKDQLRIKGIVMHLITASILSFFSC